MDRTGAYIPIDRRHALVRGERLPEHTSGAALFADISGFTPLTEALALELGPRRGAEELTVHLNRVYDALIAELHRYGGSVIGFSGDAITCWLDGDDGRRAVAVGLAMQAAMAQFAEVRTFSGRVISLGMKVAIATGPVRRFVVGDPQYLLTDVMAGQTLTRLADAEHMAERGDIVADEETVVGLGRELQVAAWRVDEHTGERFAVIAGLGQEVPPTPWPELPVGSIGEAMKESWLLPPVFRRLSGGQGEFLAELRPAVALFLRFSGIDYDDDPDAPERLNNFICGVEQILMRYDGSLIQLTVGDKGSYLYAAFGAPVAHEDDAIRAASSALAMQELAQTLDYLDDLQIGITVGRMRTGAYGSRTRRTYGVLGDATNLSARLMSAAKPGQILVSDAAREASGDVFEWEMLPQIRVKGKSEPVTLARLVGIRRQRGSRTAEPEYALPMVGRTEELAQLSEKLDAALAGSGQIVGLAAEAGMGKSRLAAEVMRLARQRGFALLTGECQSYGTNTSYLVWQNVWNDFFGLDHDEPPDAQIARLETALYEIEPTLVARLPLLGTPLNLRIPDTPLTASLDAKVRKTSLEELLLRCLQVGARRQPLLIVLEDSHWLDPLSKDLIEEVARAMVGWPLVLLLVYRPADGQDPQTPRIDHLPYYTEVSLTEFTEEQAAELIRLKLQQFFGAAELQPALVERVTAQAAGNPFYIEELLNYLHDLGVDPGDSEALSLLDLPTSIHSLVLSRIDQLTEDAQITIKVASVIGRLFRAAMVWGIYPELGEFERVLDNLQLLSELDLTPLDVPEPELAYIFKHVITQQVAYESLLHATRAALHEQIGHYIERVYPETLDQYLDLLAYHYEQSPNDEKKRHYLLRAGEAARSGYANAAAINYLSKAIPLLDGRERADVRLNLGRVYELTGSWEQAGEQYQAALEQAERIGDQDAQAWAEAAIGELMRKRNRYEESASWLAQARSRFEAADNPAGVGQVLHYAGTLAAQQADYETAIRRYNDSLALRRELGDRVNEANLLNNLGIISRYMGDVTATGRYYQECLTIREEIGDPWPMLASLANLGTYASEQGDYAEARELLKRAVELGRQVGDRWHIANAIHNLANVAREEGEYDEARTLYGECIERWLELEDRWVIAYWLEDVAMFYALQGEARRALELDSAGAALREDIGVPRPPSHQQRLDQVLGPVANTLDEAEQQAARAAGSALSLEMAIALL